VVIYGDPTHVELVEQIDSDAALPGGGLLVIPDPDICFIVNL